MQVDAETTHGDFSYYATEELPDLQYQYPHINLLHGDFSGVS